MQDLLNRLEAVDTDLQRERNRMEKAQHALPNPSVTQSIERTISFLEQERQQLLTEINDHIDQHPDLKQDVELLRSIPGVGDVIARIMAVALRHGQRFDSASQAAAYFGLIPVAETSGSSVNRKARLSKAGNPIYRRKLYMAAVVASQCNPDARALYQRLLDNGKCKMAALGAVMRKLVHICFGVIKHQTPFQQQSAHINA